VLEIRKIQFLTKSSQLLAFSFQLLVFSFQFSVFSSEGEGITTPGGIRRGSTCGVPRPCLHGRRL